MQRPDQCEVCLTEWRDFFKSAARGEWADIPSTPDKVYPHEGVLGAEQQDQDGGAVGARTLDGSADVDVEEAYWAGVLQRHDMALKVDLVNAQPTHERVPAVQGGAAAHTLPRAERPERVGAVGAVGSVGQRSLTPGSNLQTRRVARVRALAGQQ